MASEGELQDWIGLDSINDVVLHSQGIRTLLVDFKSQLVFTD